MSFKIYLIAIYFRLRLLYFKFKPYNGVDYPTENSLYICSEQRSDEKQINDPQQTSRASSSGDGVQHQKAEEKAADGECGSSNQSDRSVHDSSNSNSSDMTRARPMSPGTLALMCDEQDTMFMGAGLADGSAAHDCNTSSHVPDRSLSEVYIEQERIVLTKFRDCLNKLITLGEIKGKLVSLDT